jgi:hypothetical protein
MGGRIGLRDYNLWKQGKRLTRQEQINAMCYECNGLEDSFEDCRGERSCPLYPYSPSAQRRGCIGGVVPMQDKRKGICR